MHVSHLEGPIRNALSYWRDLFSGATVCIVGNAEVTEPPVFPVDEHDVVIRFNDCVRGGFRGTKTSLYCTADGRSLSLNPRSRRIAGVLTASTGSRSDPRKDCSWHFVGLELESELGCWPSSGLMAFYVACLLGARHVSLVGMTLAPSLQRVSPPM